MRWGPLVAWGAVAFAAAGLFVLVSRIELNAARSSGHTEEYLRTKFIRVIVRRRSGHENIPFPSPDYHTSMSIAARKDFAHKSDKDSPELNEKAREAIETGEQARTVAAEQLHQGRIRYDRLPNPDELSKAV